MNKVMSQGIERMQLLMMNTVFLGGLRDDIRTRVLEESPTKPQESVKAAREIESILNDKKSQVFMSPASTGLMREMVRTWATSTRRKPPTCKQLTPF